MTEEIDEKIVHDSDHGDGDPVQEASPEAPAFTTGPRFIQCLTIKDDVRDKGRISFSYH
jgi:hypothetical protein